MDATETRLVETEKQLSIHEAVCAKRYEAIQQRFDDGSKRMKRIEYILYLLATTLFLGVDNIQKLIKVLIGV